MLRINYAKFTIVSFLLLSMVACTGQNGAKMKTSSTIEVSPTDTKDSIILKAAHVVPTPNQYEALKNEFIAFVHFGPNTFTRNEWGNGMEDPSIFNLQNLDTDQWCEAMKAAGMKTVVFTAKHHDGFCLWQSRYTKHGVMSSPFEKGKGDILKNLSVSCHKYGLKLGVYLSPADLYQIENSKGLYGNLSKYTKRVIPRKVEGRPFENKTTFEFKVDDYNEYMLNQLFEVLTEYGPIHEVWFDGAHPKRKGGQKYNYIAWKELIHKLAPEAVTFGKQDLRWCGNESGGTRDTEWNVVPFATDPSLMDRFPDITNEDIGSRKQLYKAKFLHFQPAETNTSIREGWFYRDDTEQKVRNADDVFDIYERSVGGNSIFLLNIPPNREGRFSDEDVAVLKETGKRIKQTYSTNLFDGAKGAENVLDNDDLSYELLPESKQELEISTPKAVTINRIVVQEAITTHGERIEKLAIDAWINDAWTEIANCTNVGYKRILRFPAMTSKKFRLRVLESRAIPAISNVAAFYYESRPPQLAISRGKDGMVSIGTKKHNFGWKPHGENAEGNLSAGMTIRYTLDGSEPLKTSKLYKDPFSLSSGEVNARAFLKKEDGSVEVVEFGILKNKWKVIGESGSIKKHASSFAFDEDVKTYWQSNKNKANKHYLAIDLGAKFELKGFIYSPQTDHAEGMIQKGQVLISSDGKRWKVYEDFIFGNLINDPTSRKHNFKKSLTTRYIKIQSVEIANNGNTAAIAEFDLLPVK